MKNSFYTLSLCMICQLLMGCSENAPKSIRAKVSQPPKASEGNTESSVQPKGTKEDLKQKVIEKHGDRIDRSPELESGPTDFLDQQTQSSNKSS